MCCAGSGFFAPHVGVGRSKYLVSFYLLDSHHESHAGTRRWPFRELWPGTGSFEALAIGDCLLSGSIVHTAPGGPCGEKRSDHQRLPSVGAFTNDQRPGRELGPANVLRKRTCIPINAHPGALSTMYLPKSAECQAHVRVAQGLTASISSTRETSVPACHILQYFALEGKMNHIQPCDRTLPTRIGSVHPTAQYIIAVGYNLEGASPIFAPASPSMES